LFITKQEKKIELNREQLKKMSKRSSKLIREDRKRSTKGIEIHDHLGVLEDMIDHEKVINYRDKDSCDYL